MIESVTFRYDTDRGAAWRGEAGYVSRNVAASRRELCRTDERRGGSTSAIRRNQSTNGSVVLFTAMRTLTRHEVEFLVLCKTGARPLGAAQIARHRTPFGLVPFPRQGPVARRAPACVRSRSHRASALSGSAISSTEPYQ